MMNSTMTAVLSLACGLAMASGVASSKAGDARPEAASMVPAAWLAAWKEPPPADRPLQIIHGIDSRRALPEGIHQMLREQGPAALSVERMRVYKDRGLGGVVCNVAFEQYLRSEDNWRALVEAIEAFAKLGMVVWIYDEEGYPSGAAGGLVLKENPQFEATELVFDPSRPDPFALRPAYEFTHPSNNYYAARRYINLLDDRAVQAFLATTHAAYARRLGPHLGATVQAMFTDEPSLVAVNLGQIGEPARSKVRVVDPLDPAVRPLPSVPWCYDLPERYRQRYGDDLMPHRRSLFVGQSPEDRKVRRQFWALVADLVADRYFGAIQQWCKQHRLASSGHSLWEEAVLHHVPLEGNGLKVLGRMDIPGLDMLTSDPEAVLHSGWMTAALPLSAAVLNGRRRVMTEVSDFSQTQGGRGPAELPEMQATAAWQAAWGVTEFTLYYAMASRSVPQYRAYCDYVGRLNAILKPAQCDARVLVYYPIYDLWAEYLPVAEPLRITSQTPRAQRIVGSFMGLGHKLQRSQIPFLLIDHENLAAATVRPDGKLVAGGHSFESLVLPEGVELPPAAETVARQFRERGGRVVIATKDADAKGAGSLAEKLAPEYRIAPASPAIALGQFVRDGRSIVLAANVGRNRYEGSLTTSTPGTWQALDPADGTIRAAETRSPNHLKLSLGPRQAILLVRSPAKP